MRANTRHTKYRSTGMYQIMYLARSKKGIVDYITCIHMFLFDQNEACFV